MGFRISFAASPMAPEALAAGLGLAQTGRAEEMPESGTFSFRTDAGWSVVWASDETFTAMRGEALAVLSRRAPVLSVTVSEGVMVSQADLREGGALVWSVLHRGDEGPCAEPAIEGTPPPEYAALRARQAAAQAADDGLVDHMFEVPVELARGLCGFRHDAWVEPEEGFALLGPARRGLLSRLFGR